MRRQSKPLYCPWAISGGLGLYQSTGHGDQVDTIDVESMLKGCLGHLQSLFVGVDLMIPMLKRQQLDIAGSIHLLIHYYKRLSRKTLSLKVFLMLFDDPGSNTWHCYSCLSL